MSQLPAWIGITLALLFVALNGFFVAAEFAMVKVRSTRLSSLVRKGNPAARTARRVIDRLDQYLNATQLGITLSSLALGWIGEPALASTLAGALHAVGIDSPALLHGLAFGLAFGLLSIVHILFGELVPKSMGIRRAEQLALRTAGPLIVFRLIFWPILSVLDWLSSIVLQLLGVPPPQSSEGALTEDEIRSLVEMPHGGADLPETKRALMTRVLRSADRPVRKVMVPRVDIAYITREMPIDVVRERARSAGFSRLPVTIEDDIDRVIGYIHVRDLFVGERGPAAQLDPILREPVFVPETTTVGDLLHELRASRVHMAIVLDEYGGTGGLVTLEDLLEELVGEIQDEFDVEDAKFVPLGEGRAMVDASLSVSEAALALGVESPDGESDTIAGFVLTTLGRMARQGDRVAFGSLVAEVATVRRRRVTRVLLRPPLQDESPLEGIPDRSAPSEQATP